MEFKNIFSKKVFLLITIISILWILILLVTINIIQRKNTKEKSQLNNRIKEISILNDRYSEIDKKIQIFKKDDLSLYISNINERKHDVYIKNINSDRFEILLQNERYYGDDALIYETELPNMILYRGYWGDVGAWIFNDIYIDMINKRSLKISGGNGYTLEIDDGINEYYDDSIIQVSVNDQCRNKNIKKAWIKDININGYPQGIFNEEYEIECVPDDEVGDLVYLNNISINKSLNKVFFSYETTKVDGKEVLENYSFNLLTKKINLEEPNTVLKLDSGKDLYSLERSVNKNN